MGEERMILPSDPEAAKFVTVQGWVSRDGRFYGDDERIARYAGSTHGVCADCLQPAPKSRIYCGRCERKREIAKYDALPKKPWDGMGMVYSEEADRYFNDWEEVEEHCQSIECEPTSLRLLICEPVFANEIDPGDYYVDDLPGEEHEVPDGLVEIFEELNAKIKQLPPLSWTPGKVAVDCDTPAAPPGESLNHE